jgi:hypothetical protein
MLSQIQMSNLLRVILGLLCLLAEVRGDEPVDFVRDVQPIFQQKCYGCHGPDKQQSSYRLDVRKIAFAGGDSGEPAIVPHQTTQSTLWNYVRETDADLRMPPKDSGIAALTPAEIQILTTWINTGAAWPAAAQTVIADPRDWWSLKPLVPPKLPPGNEQPIDAFVIHKLSQHGLTLSPAADARTLCRRLYFDLIGLPPTPAELDEFEKASQKDPDLAYQKLVDTLLESPRYGERWARYWLDVVHYADTHGYDKDKPRPNAWPYRDYVIRSFNNDKSYAQFIEEQIAGDVLYPQTQDGIEALGFISAGPWDLIGHAEVPESKIDGKIARHLDRDDMLGNAIGTLCSTTIQCAQCHYHKFDPISQEDYYSLQAVFAAVDRADKSYDLDPEVARVRAALNTQRNQLRLREKEIAILIDQQAGTEYKELLAKITAIEKGDLDKRPPQHGWHSAISPTVDSIKWVQLDLGSEVEIDKVILIPAYDDFNQIGAGFGFPVRFKIESSTNNAFTDDTHLITSLVEQNYPSPGITPQVFSAGKIKTRFIRVTATQLAPRKDDFIFALSEIQVMDPTGKNIAGSAQVTSLDSIEAPIRWGRLNLIDDLYPTTAPDSLQALRKQREEILQQKVEARIRDENQAVKQQLADIQHKLSALPPVKIVYAGTVHTGTGTFTGTGANQGKPRTISILPRGDVTKPGHEVGPGALEMITTLPARFTNVTKQPEGERRAALAKWITASENPLTWRSIANRVWQYHFGHGLVETSNDFGRMGSLPSHPELLDWLAIELREHQGKLKHLHRTILLSKTYRQVSMTSNNHAQQLDPGNAWLWRQNRRKLEAEAVRDSVLSVSGNLKLEMGGPGWQDFVMTHPEHSPHYEYDLSNPEDQKTWRRSIYRFIVRSQTQPLLTVLDCADPSMRVGNRNESVSPAQALALLNNDFMVTQARYFALRVEREAGSSLTEQIDRAYLLATGHPPPAGNRDHMVAYVKRYGLPNFCRVLLNLNEFNFVD